MKLVMNQHVRDCIKELEAAMDDYDALTMVLGNPDTCHAAAVDAGAHRMRRQDHIIAIGMRLLNHASRGKRYPHMTKLRADKARSTSKKPRVRKPKYGPTLMESLSNGAL